MAHDKIPNPAHGIAAFSSASFSGPQEPLYSGDVPLTTDHVEVNNTTGAELTLPYLAVVSYVPATGVMAMADQVADDAYAVLPAAVTLAIGETITVPIYREGYFEQDALVWDASYDTDLKKKFAFENSVNNILIGKKGHSDQNIVV